MNKPLRLKMIALFVVPLLFCSAAWCQNVSGKEDQGIGKERPVPEEADPMPIWKQLDAMSDCDKKNALIRLEGPANPDPVLLREFAAIESLWNSGGPVEAVERLRSLEQTCGIGLAVGISWLKPKSTSGGRWNGGVQVGNQSGVNETALDFHRDTGHLFIVLLRDGGISPCWTMNFSSDGGQTWYETYQYSNLRRDVIDIDAAVVDDYCYVGYAPEGIMYGSYPTGYIRRFSVLDGTHDDVYVSQTVISIGEDIREVDLVSNADLSGNRIYYYALMEDDKIQFYWANEDGMSWASYGPAASGASHGLKAAYKEGSAAQDIDLVACYVDTSGTVRVAMLGDSGWSNVSIGPGDSPDIGGYFDHIIVVYEYNTGSDLAIRYEMSDDDGGSWYWGWVQETGINFSPAVTARNEGIAVVWNEEAGAFDPCWFRWSNYGHYWLNRESFGGVDVLSGSCMSVEWLPDVHLDYGAVSIEDESGSRHAMFDRRFWPGQSFSLDVDPDPLVGGQPATFAVAYGSPDVPTYLAYSLAGPGSTYIPLLDVTLDMSNPVPVGGAITLDSAGNGWWDLTVPPQAAGLNVWFQAVQYQDKTNVVATSVQ